MSEQDIPTADELRRRREELGLNTVQAAGTVRCGFWAGLIEHLLVERALWASDRAAGGAAILAALAKLAEEPEPDRAEPAADPDPMPEPPEGVRPPRLLYDGGWEVSNVHGVIGNAYRGGVTPDCCTMTASEALYLGHLSEWAARQHTRTQQAEREAERARLLEAVRVAKGAHSAACEEVRRCDDELFRAQRAGDATREALAAAQEAALRKEIERTDG